jgi:glycosyltransferase involved in cell wall biosynthesis
MKVALIVTSLHRSGPSIFTRNLAIGLKRLDVDVHVFYFDDILEIDLPVAKTRLRFWHSHDFSDYDIVHSTGFRPDLYNAFFVAGKRTSCITGIHNFLDVDLRSHYGYVKATIGRFVWGKAIARINYLIVSSEQMKQFYRSYFGRKTVIELIPYGIDPPVQRATQIDSEVTTIVDSLRKRGLHLIISCGVFYKRKGFDTLIAAVAKSPNTALLLIGDGPEMGRLTQLASHPDIIGRVVFLGTRKDSAQYYSLCDIYAHTSLSEGFGLAMIEALAGAMPLVCSDLPIYSGFFEKDDVVRFTPSNIGSLCDAIMTCIARLSELKITSLNLYRKHFSLDAMAERHLATYKNMAKATARF